MTQDKHAEQYNRGDDPEINPDILRELIFKLSNTYMHSLSFLVV